MSFTPEQIARLSELLEREAGPEPIVPDSSLAPAAVIPESEDTTAAPSPPARVRLYSPKRRGYLRSTREEGIGEELKQMHDEARGTPFYDVPSKEPARPIDLIRRASRTGKK